MTKILVFIIISVVSYSLSQAQSISYPSGGGGGTAIINSVDVPLDLTAGVLSIPQATTSQSGYLSSADFTAFENASMGSVTSVTASSPVHSSGGTTPNISIQQATTSQGGFLSSADWNTFNSKSASFTTGNLTQATSDVLTITGGTGAVIGSGTTIQVLKSTATQDGYLSSTDWSTFNGKQAALSFTAPLNNTSNVVSIPLANTSQSGYLSSADWNTFNSKGSGTVTSVTGTTPVVSSGGSTPAISIPQANATQSGYLASSDWSTFNGKSSSFSSGNLTDAGTDGIVVTGGTGSVIGSGTSLAQSKATTSQNGYLSSADWTTFNSKGSGTVTSVTGTTPVVSSGGTTPAISIPLATTSQSGYISSADWTTFNNKVSSQWTTLSTNIYYDTGSVGIGTTIPAAPLNVSSTTNPQIGITNSTGPSTSYGTIGMDPYGDMYLNTTTNSGDGSIVLKPYNGNIAFYGSSGAPYNYGNINTTNTYFNIQGASVPITFSDYSYGEHMRITTTGLVGIGTTSPNATFVVSGHQEMTGTVPTVGSGSSDCGTSPSIVGNDNVGRITAGSSTNGGACTVTFNTSWNNAPICSTFDETTGILVRPTSVGTASFKITGVIVAGDKLSYHCIGYE